MTLLARFKAATGLSDRAIAELLGKPRSTVQAALAGKLQLDPDPAALRPVITDRLDKLAHLLDATSANHKETTE